MAKATWGRNSLFDLHFHITIYYWRKSGQKLKHGKEIEAGTDDEGIEACDSVACSLLFEQSAVLQNPGPQDEG